VWQRSLIYLRLLTLIWHLRCCQVRTSGEKTSVVCRMIMTMRKRQILDLLTALGMIGVGAPSAEPQGVGQQSPGLDNNKFRVWQMSKPWSEVLPKIKRNWTESERSYFYQQQRVVELMKRFGYDQLLWVHEKPWHIFIEKQNHF